MKLRTRLQVSAVFPVALAIIVTLSLFVRSRSIAEARRALAVSEQALPMISRVNSDLYTYIGRPSVATKAEWVRSRSTLVAYCEANEGVGGVLGFLVSEVRESAVNLEVLAEAAADGNGALNEKLGAEVGVLFARGFKLLSVSKIDAEAKEQASETAFLVFIAVFAMLMTGSLFSASSKIMKRLNAMQAVCDKVRAGDMKQRIDVTTDDEIAEFGASFNLLVKKFDRDLAKLSAEVGQHRKGEASRDTVTAAAREGNIKLADALTKLKRAQVETVQQERVLALEQVVTGVARDFNDVLSPVLTMSDFLLDYPEKLKGRDDLKEDIRVINTSARKALRQVKVLTDLFQSFEEPYPQKLRLSDMVDDAMELVKKGSRHDLSAYKIKKDFDEASFVAGNEVDYMEAIRNLVENAFESMKDGGVLRMTMKEEGKKVLFSVRDDGEGMSDEVYSRALEPFFSTKGKGHSGMGLTFVVVAIGKFGGSVDIQSSAGQGSTVTLGIPLFDPQIHKKEIEEEPEVIDGKLKILVIDDEEWTRVVLSRALGSEGHDVAAAEGGISGLKRFKDGGFDAVILDRAMPDMTGDEVAAKILEADSSMPVVMLTGFGDLMIEKGEVVPGVDVILSKPITVNDLKIGIGKAIRTHKG